MTDLDAAQTFLSGAYIESIGKVTRTDFIRAKLSFFGNVVDEAIPQFDKNSLPHTVFSSTTATFTQSFVPNPEERYNWQSGSTGALRATQVEDGSGKLAFDLRGDIKAIYVPFSEVFKVWTPGPTTGTPALTIPGPQLAFFSGSMQNYTVPVGGFGTMIVSMQAIGSCGVPTDRRTWEPQKYCLCMDRITVKFGQAFWPRWHGGTGECDTVMRAACTGWKLDTPECACIKEEVKYGENVECLGPSCSKDFANLAYRPGSVTNCTQTVCKQFLGDGTFDMNLPCGGVKFNMTPAGPVASAAEAVEKTNPLLDYTSVSIEVWMLFGAGLVLFCVLLSVLVMWYQDKKKG